MNWIRRLVRRLIGPDRYHEQANEVQNRVLRTDKMHRDALALRLDVRTRGHE